MKIDLLSIYLWCGMSASWATRHTVVCLVKKVSKDRFSVSVLIITMNPTLVTTVYPESSTQWTVIEWDTFKMLLLFTGRHSSRIYVDR